MQSRDTDPRGRIGAIKARRYEVITYDNLDTEEHVGLACLNRGRFSPGDKMMTRDALSRLKEKGLTEAKKLLWIFAYLWVLLGLFALHKSIVLGEP